MKYFVTIVSALLLAACSSSQIETSQKSLITACNSYAISLSSLADFRAKGKLDTDTVRAVDQVVMVAAPLCDPKKPLPTDLVSSVGLVQDSGLKLAQILLNVSK